MTSIRRNRILRTFRTRSVIFVKTSSLMRKSKVSFTRRLPSEANSSLKFGRTGLTRWCLQTFKLWKVREPASAPSSNFYLTLTCSCASKKTRSTSTRSIWSHSFPRSMRLTISEGRRSDKKSSNCRHSTKSMLRKNECSFSSSSRRLILTLTSISTIQRTSSGTK